MTNEHPSEPLTGLVVGLGVMGSHHLRVLSSMQEVRVAAVVDPSPERRAQAERAHPRTLTYERVLDAVEDLTIDFACIAVPVQQLAVCAQQALRAGVHALVEKPTALDEREATETIECAEQRQLIVAAGHVERFNPAVITLKHKLDEGLAGRIYQMHARRLSPFPDRDSMRGVALDLATHDIDVMRYLTGQEVDRVFAETSQRYHKKAEDLLCATLRFGNDATGLLEVNWLTPTKVRELTVTGELGMFRVDYLTQDLFFYEHPLQPTEWGALAGMRGPGEGDMIRYALTRREPLRLQWESFIHAITTNSPALVDGRDGLAALSTARAIQQSGETHTTATPAYRSSSLMTVDEHV